MELSQEILRQDNISWFTKGLDIHSLSEKGPAQTVPLTSVIETSYECHGSTKAIAHRNWPILHVLPEQHLLLILLETEHWGRWTLSLIQWTFLILLHLCATLMAGAISTPIFYGRGYMPVLKQKPHNNDWSGVYFKLKSCTENQGMQGQTQYHVNITAWPNLHMTCIWPAQSCVRIKVYLQNISKVYLITVWYFQEQRSLSYLLGHRVKPPAFANTLLSRVGQSLRELFFCVSLRNVWSILASDWGYILWNISSLFIFYSFYSPGGPVAWIFQKRLYLSLWT